MTDANPNEPSGSELRAQFEAQLAERDRENAMLRAGIDLESPMGRMFAKGYDGKVAVDDIKAAWAEVAPAATPAPTEPAPDTTTTTPPAPGATTEEAAMFDEAGNLIGGATTPIGDNGPDPTQGAIDSYWQARREGKDDETAEAIGFDVLFGAAAKGDPRVILSGGRKGGE